MRNTMRWVYPSGSKRRCCGAHISVTISAVYDRTPAEGGSKTEQNSGIQSQKNSQGVRGQNDAVRRHENNKAAREHAESRIGDGAECGTYSRTWKAAAVPTRAEGDSAAAHKFGKPYTAE